MRKLNICPNVISLVNDHTQDNTQRE